MVDGRLELVHIHDPGRLAELLRPGAKVCLRAKRHGKTRFYVVCTEAWDGPVLIDSAVHNRIARWLVEEGLVFPGHVVESVEPRYGRGRLDLLLRSPNGGRVLVEVKGVTLCRGGLALFPDAPTQRGARHMEELIRAVSEGFGAAVLFLVLRRCAERFSPNWELDRRFSEALTRAARSGVTIVAYKVVLDWDWCLRPVGEVPIELSARPSAP